MSDEASGSENRWWPDDRDRDGGSFWVASRCWSAFGHQITSAAPITGLRPPPPSDIKSAWPSLTSTVFPRHLEPLTRDQTIAHTIRQYHELRLLEGLSSRYQLIGSRKYRRERGASFRPLLFPPRRERERAFFFSSKKLINRRRNRGRNKFK